MEVDMKRRYAAMAAALETEDDDDPLPKKRSCWVKPWLQDKSLGIQNHLYNELLEQDPEEYRKLLRVPHNVFFELLERIRHRIEKADTNMRRSISAKTRLQVTLRFLATGESQYSLSRQFRLGHSSVSGIITSTCQAIYEELGPEMIQMPKSEEEWLQLAERFRDRWQFPNCVGGIDGKHVAITKPAKSGSLYFSYKKIYSIILFALVDADYKFLYLDVGAPGSKGDGSIWQSTPLQKAITRKSAKLPQSVKIGTLQLPPVVVGDDAFPLSPNLMKPYGGDQLSPQRRIFNYRLSRARRVTENAFGILAHRFRFLLTTVHARPDRVTAMVQAACVLHNLLRGQPLDHSETTNTSGNEKVYFSLRPSNARAGALATAVRERLTDYFNGDGAVPWQNVHAGLDISRLRKRVA